MAGIGSSSPGSPGSSAPTIPLLPVEQVDDRLWVKRDDLYKPYDDLPIGGAKAYQCLSLLKGRLDEIRADYGGTVYSENYLSSPQGPIVAAICQKLGIKCIIPVGTPKPEGLADRYPTVRFIQEWGGTVDVVCKVPQAHALTAPARKKYGGKAFHVAFGMNALDKGLSRLVLGPVADQVEAFRGHPTETMTLVVPTGSGVVFAGILLGLARSGIKFKKIVSVQIAGKDRSKDIRARIGDVPVPAYDHIPDGTYDYNRLVPGEIGDIELDKRYEAKAWAWVTRELRPDEPVLFYIIGNSNWCHAPPDHEAGEGKKKGVPKTPSTPTPVVTVPKPPNTPTPVATVASDPGEEEANDIDEIIDEIDVIPRASTGPEQATADHATRPPGGRGVKRHGVGTASAPRSRDHLRRPVAAFWRREDVTGQDRRGGGGAGDSRGAERNASPSTGTTPAGAPGHWVRRRRAAAVSASCGRTRPR